MVGQFARPPARLSPDRQRRGSPRACRGGASKNRPRSRRRPLPGRRLLLCRVHQRCKTRRPLALGARLASSNNRRGKVMMTRFLTVGAAQMGPIQRSHMRRDVVERLIAHLREARRMGCDLVVFPELTLTTFFPRWWMTDQAEIDSFFEREMPGNETAPLFTEAKRLGLGMSFGYAELANEGGRTRHFNTSIIVEKDGRIAGKYRKVHLPGHSEHEPQRPFQHLEKRYFEVGNLGFPVFKALGGNMGMCICNDRRWPETYRVMGLQNVEMVMLGYNTPL